MQNIMHYAKYYSELFKGQLHLMPHDYLYKHTFFSVIIMSEGGTNCSYNLFAKILFFMANKYSPH